jgi:hypothetical protein
MSALIKAIEEQLSRCKSLLSMFMEERNRRPDGKAAGRGDILRSMLCKKQLADVLSEKQAELCGMLRAEAAEPGDDEKRRALIRELAGTLEQLLVIDYENEKLIRSAMTSSEPARAVMPNRAPAPAPAAAGFRPRPALQQRLPFLPPSFSPSAAPSAGRFSALTPAPSARPLSAPRPTAAAVVKNDTPAGENAPAADSQERPALIRSSLKKYTAAANIFKFAPKYA